MAEKKKSVGGKVGLAAAIVGAVAAGYFLYGKEGKERRVKFQAWTLRAKADVLEQLQKSKDVSQESYNTAVDKVTDKYSKVKSVGADEASKLNRELKRHWKAIVEAATSEAPKKKRAAGAHKASDEE